MKDVYYPDWLIRQILRDADTIAMVGISPRWIRPSYFRPDRMDPGKLTMF